MKSLKRVWAAAQRISCAYKPREPRAKPPRLSFLEDFSNDLLKLPLKKYACVVDNNALSIKSVNFDNGSVVIIGNEANGITTETKSVSDFEVTIKMTGKAESLNAAAAAAIAIWEMMK